MSLSVESWIVAYRGVSRCRSMSPSSGGVSQVFSRARLRQERCEIEVMVSSILKSYDLGPSKNGCSRSSIGFRCADQRLTTFGFFREITRLVQSGAHLSASGIESILELRGPMNRGGNRRRSDDEIIAILRDWESSETIRRAPSMKQRDEDMVHASWRHGETQ